jgi:ribosomal protein S18 acetylase RimI-like enzyme
MHAVDLPEQLTASAYRPGLDDDAAVAVVAAYDQRYLQRAGEPASAVLAQIAQLPAGGMHDVLVIGDQDRAVGMVICEPATGRGAEAPVPEHWFDVFVVPGPYTGYLETPLVATGLARLCAVADPGRPGRAQSGTARADTATTAALTGHGLTHVRTFWEMERQLGAEDDDPGPTPTGVVVRTVTDGPDGRALIHRLEESSFAEHWGHQPRDEQEWWSDRMGRLGQDPSQWWVAELDGEPVALCVGEASRADAGAGYVAILGVLAQARGHGIAKHLLRMAFAEHRRRGWSLTALRVDSTNSTGATALYRSVGMSEIEVFDIYERTIVADPTTLEPS